VRRRWCGELTFDGDAEYTLFELAELYCFSVRGRCGIKQQDGLPDLERGAIGD